MEKAKDLIIKAVKELKKNANVIITQLVLDVFLFLNYIQYTIF